MKTFFGILLIVIAGGFIVMLMYTLFRSLVDVTAVPKEVLPDTTKLCIDCDHMKESGMMSLYCDKSGDISLVNGKHQNQKYCSDCRDNADHCGPSGKFFSGENKIKERLKG